jgi:hypothetical protein
VRKIGFHFLALGLGLLSSQCAFGQYGYNNNFGPSSFPVQNVNPQHVLASLPQVPQNYQQSFQLVGTQEQLENVYGVPAPQMSAPPAPQSYAPQQFVTPLEYAAPPYVGQNNASPSNMAPPNNMAQPSTMDPGCSTCTPNAPPMNYGYVQSIAPNCTSCGPAPVSQPMYAPSYNSCGPVAYNAPGLFANAEHSAGFGGGRFAAMGGLPQGAKPWFFGGGYMLMNRIDDHYRPLALRDATFQDLLRTSDAQMNATSGYQVMAGRYFNCGKNAIQASYWGIQSDTETASIVGGPADFRSRVLATGNVLIGVDPTGAAFAGYDVYDWFDNGYTHQVTRSSEFHNVEVNLLGFAVGCAARNFNRSTAGSLFSGARGHAGCGYCGGACGACAPAPASKFATGPTGYIAPGCGSRLNLSWLAGLRYFRFNDNLQYATSFLNNGVTRAVDDLYYDVNTTNDLVGAQIGGRGDYCLTSKFNLFGIGKVGVFNNRSNLYSRIGTDNQVAYEGGSPTTSYLVDQTDNRVAFMSEIGAGLGMRISSKWTATVGYQAVIASGVATSVGNIRHPNDLVRDQAYIDNTDVLVLHGMTLGALYNF